MNKYYIILFSTLFYVLKLNAQDVTFSQPYNTSQLSNPAFVGTGMYSQRIKSELRSQFFDGNNIFSTVAIGWDTKISRKNSEVNNYMGIGAQVISDRLLSGVIQNNYLTLNLAYHIFLDKNLYQNIAFGLGGSYAQTTFDKSKLFFGDQYNSAGGLTNTGSLESLIASPSSAALNSGVLYTNHRENIFLQVGVGVNFANKPAVTYNYLKESAGMKLSGMLNAETKIFYDNTILFHGEFIKRDSSSNYNYGIAFSFPFANNWEQIKRLYIGCFTRDAEVFVPNISILSDKLAFGFSYDFDSQKATNSQIVKNVFEVSFSKSFGYKRRQLFRTIFD